jgi:hypothetical protein
VDAQQESSIGAEFVASGSCEEIGHSIKVATVVEMVQPLDCKREPSTRFTPHGGD